LTGILQENVKEMLDNAYIRERTEFKFNGGSKMNLQEIITKKYNKGIADCSNEELYFALLEMTKAMAEKKENHNGKKKLYYISAEFLIGKLLSNNLINLGVYDEVRDVLAANGKDICAIEEVEPEPSLGNGGLGRLAACFLDSIATLGLNGDGVGLNYHYGLFKQVFENNLQKETKNPWIQDESWLTKTDKSYQVQFGGFNVTSKLYDIDVTGYENTTNKLHLFDIETVDESIVGDGIDFDKEDIKKNLTLFLYPDDSDDKGRLLRVYQQYFMVSNAAQLILDEAVERGCNLHDLADYAVIQINDTHPSMVIPEMIRLLMERGIGMDEAIAIVSKCCAYTNHTILAEALEKWPISFLEKVVPQLMPIIYELNNRVVAKYDDKSVYIIDDEKRVHMAHMDIHYGFSVNGVAYLHTEILKDSELNNFYKIYPEKFNNKTNGITFRRWLLHCDKGLTSLIEELIGPGFKKDAMELEKLGQFVNDDAVLDKLLAIKTENKVVLKNYLKATQNIDLDENSVFDIQIKRLHEYKRQQMNALYVINKYFEIKAGKKPARKITAIFGAKAAPAYIIAKDIIHLILCLQQLIANDPEVSPYLQVVMVENYNVTLAEKLIPAADIHEQISLASKEASGTSNMKFMLNGAVAIGTMDGANVEMHQLVGDDNIYIFGESSDEVIEHYAKADYVSRKYYDNDADIKRAIDFIVSDEMKAIGNAENLERLFNELINKDWFMTLPDFESYRAKKDEMLADYEDRKAWAKMMLTNISKAGFFSSDRTIEQYNKDIWKLD
jgi:starch phosphorylase